MSRRCELLSPPLLTVVYTSASVNLTPYRSPHIALASPAFHGRKIDARQKNTDAEKNIAISY